MIIKDDLFIRIHRKEIDGFDIVKIYFIFKKIIYEIIKFLVHGLVNFVEIIN